MGRRLPFAWGDYCVTENRALLAVIGLLTSKPPLMK